MDDSVVSSKTLPMVFTTSYRMVTDVHRDPYPSRPLDQAVHRWSHFGQLLSWMTNQAGYCSRYLKEL